jgi:hypothetical protein
VPGTTRDADAVTVELGGPTRAAFGCFGATTGFVALVAAAALTYALTAARHRVVLGVVGGVLLLIVVVLLVVLVLAGHRRRAGGRAGRPQGHADERAADACRRGVSCRRVDGPVSCNRTGRLRGGR